MTSEKIASSLLGAAAGLAMLALLSGCGFTPSEAQWSPAESPKENRVIFLREVFEARFDPGKDQLSPAEQKRFGDFLAREEVGYGDEISIAVASGDAKDKSLAARRQASVTAYLKSLHLKAAADSNGDAPLDRAVITVARYVVVPPDCPDWSKPADDDPRNTPASNFGCANTTNLGLMVADPHDLVSGKRSNTADGERAAMAIDRYRQGKEKLPPEATEPVTGGSSGGGSSKSSSGGGATTGGGGGATTGGGATQ